MNAAALKQFFGDEYPAAVVLHGIRMPLSRERRFSRSYHSEPHRMGTEVSRFMDGSASITAAELQRGWPGWSDDDRRDFCNSCDWLHEQPDFPDMLRFIMQHGSPDEWSQVANKVAAVLPCDEAFDLLVRALRTIEIGDAANICQAIANTKHPEAEATLRSYLENVWRHPGLWEDASFVNWVAYDAVSCIAQLIELGSAPIEFDARARRLSDHVCKRNIDSCRIQLSKHYPWLLSFELPLEPPIA